MFLVDIIILFLPRKKIKGPNTLKFMTVAPTLIASKEQTSHTTIDFLLFTVLTQKVTKFPYQGTLTEWEGSLQFISSLT